MTEKIINFNEKKIEKIEDEVFQMLTKGLDLSLGFPGAEESNRKAIREGMRQMRHDDKENDQ